MLDFLDEHFEAVVMIIIFILICPFIIKCSYETGLFEYEDLNGNTGVATYCHEKLGELICNTTDNKTVKVKSYKKIN